MHADNDLFTLDVTERGHLTLVSLEGELDLASQGAFRARLVDLLVAGRTDLVLDLGGLTFLDSTGLGALIGIRRRAHALRGSLVLVCPPGTVRRVFEVVGLEKVFDIRPSVEAALAAS